MPCFRNIVVQLKPQAPVTHATQIARRRPHLHVPKLHGVVPEVGRGRLKHGSLHQAWHLRMLFQRGLQRRAQARMGPAHVR